MPEYTIRDRDSGRTVTLRGDSPPTEAELTQVFASLPKASAAPQAQAAPTPNAAQPATAENLSKAPIMGAWMAGPGAAAGAAQGAKSVAGAAVDMLPSAGGMVGGVVGSAGGPAGAIAGAAIGGAAGEGYRQVLNQLTGRYQPLANWQEAAKGMAKEGAIQGAFEGAGQAVTAGAEKLAPKLYRSYLKPSLSARNVGKADDIVQTALDEALPITKETPGNIRSLVSKLKAQVRTITDSSAETGDLTSIADQLREWGKAKYLRPGASDADYNAVLAVADRIDKHVGMVGNPATQPMRVLQDTKESLQESAHNAFGLKSGAETTAEKVGAKLTRQAIEQGAPATAPLNARMSKLIDAAAAIEKATGREGNQYVTYGGKALVGAMVGGEEYNRTRDPYMAAAKALGTTLALQPGVMSRVAIVASRLGHVSGEAPAAIARAAYEAVRLSTQQSNQDGNDHP